MSPSQYATVRVFYAFLRIALPLAATLAGVLAAVSPAPAPAQVQRDYTLPVGWATQAPPRSQNAVEFEIRQPVNDRNGRDPGDRRSKPT
jgi:hypothetical protein